MKVMIVAGARPNFMKIAPVAAELEKRGHETVLVHTGQHYDASMSQAFFDDLGIRTPDHFLRTERPATIEQGKNRLASWPLTVQGIIDSFDLALSQPRRPTGEGCPYGWTAERLNAW
ncbi:MAG TPA: UDP-N-acetylglucosamine 2-epimerase [Longimicrobiales bacterium]|nr:UDP-N-acetylglucosamine 2-epimerase [Longimicrobiales bacterium]